MIIIIISLLLDYNKYIKKITITVILNLYFFVLIQYIAMTELTNILESSIILTYHKILLYTI